MNSLGRVLVIGAGGLGSAVISTLVRSGVDRLTVIEDDVVELSNLHRQTLYADSDVGASKLDALAHNEQLRGVALELIEGRCLPDNALALCEQHDVIIEGTDNLASKFLVADAAAIARRPVVQAGAVRWTGWAFCAVPGSSCLRCLFEDIPRDRLETCAEAGVVGPVLGVLGGLQAAMALRLLEAEPPLGELWHYDGLAGVLRRTSVDRRADCPLCKGEIEDLRVERYTASCAA